MNKLMQDILLVAAREVAKELTKDAIRHGAVTAYRRLRGHLVREHPPEVRTIQRVRVFEDARERT